MGGTPINSFLGAFMGTLGDDMQQQRIDKLDRQMKSLQGQAEMLKVVFQNSPAGSDAQKEAFRMLVQIQDRESAALTGGAKTSKKGGGVPGPGPLESALFPIIDLPAFQTQEPSGSQTPPQQATPIPPETTGVKPTTVGTSGGIPQMPTGVAPPTQYPGYRGRPGPSFGTPTGVPPLAKTEEEAGYNEAKANEPNLTRLEYHKRWQEASKPETFKLAYGAAIPGDQLPTDAVDLTGEPIPVTERTKDNQWKMYQYGNSFRYEPAQTSRQGAKTKEQIQSEIADAFNKGDKAKVKQLQDELKAIDPLGAQRIQISLGGQAERHSEMEVKRATTFDDKFVQPWLDQKGRIQAIKNALATPEGWTVLGPADNTLMFSLIEQTRPVKGFRLNDAELRREFGGTGWQDKATRWVRGITSGAQIGDRQRQIVIRLLDELMERRREEILRSARTVRKVSEDLIDPELKTPITTGFEGAASSASQLSPEAQALLKKHGIGQ